MKKTVQINLSGVIFTIDEDAYFKLSDYLDAISGMFNARQGREEIMADIEARIAELFQEKLQDGKQVIGLAEVDEVIATLGQPEEFADPNAQDFGPDYYENTTRKLFRDPDDRVIGGVCSGFGHYIGVDAIWLRIAFLVAFFGFGFGILLYLLLWIVVPKARTRAEKLQMMGQPVNISSIGRSIEDEFNNFRETFRSSKKKGQIGRGVEKTFRAVTDLLVAIFNIVLKIFGVIFVLIGSLFAIGTIAALTGNANIINLGAGGYSIGFSIFEFGELVFDGPVHLCIALVGSILFILVPFLALTYGGLKLLSSQRMHVPFLGLVFFVLWVSGLALTAYSAIHTAHQFSKEEHIVTIHPMEGLQSDTIAVKLGPDVFHIEPGRRYHVHDDLLIKTMDNNIYLGNVRLDIEPASDSVPVIKMEKVAMGPSHSEARQKAEGIRYEFLQNQNILEFPASFSFDGDYLLRGQEVQVTVGLPVGYSVYLENGIERVLYDVRNTTNTYDPEMTGHHWKMTADGLTCTDCTAGANY